jgi:transcriptional antiterminator RfaH
MNALPPFSENLPWHVLLVKPRSEKKVGNRLKELGFDACVPTQYQLRQWSDRRKKVEVVLFNNYVFVATDLKRRNDVFRVPNVFQYLRFNGRDAMLTPREASTIKQLAGLERLVEISYEQLRAGQVVEVLSGPFAGCHGKVASTNSGSRLQLELPSLGCFARVEVSGEDVMEICSRSSL